MRIFALLFAFILAARAGQDPEYQSLERAYAALQLKSYGTAIPAFLTAIAAAPKRVDIRKDLAYTYLKIGEPEAAREQFRLAMELDPLDLGLAMEFAFLSYEATEDAIPAKAQARRIFDRIRKTGNATAEQAFQNIDGPLESGIERWSQALKIAPESFSAHYELAQLAEQRDELALAEEQYLRAWKMLPGRKAVLLDFARVAQERGAAEQVMAALIAVSRGGEARAADRARGLLPQRYPYVYEFRAALALDPSNQQVHRELAYLLLAMRDPGAENEFRDITVADPDDLVSAAQLGFLYLAAGDRIAAMPLLEHVLAGHDQELSSRVRSAIEPFSMAKKSLEAGFLKDALRYLNIAHESDPDDDEIILKLGWAYNMLHDDRTAEHWFDLARRSPNGAIASEAERAFQNLKSSLELFRTTAWVLPFYSSRWNDVFAYGQIKTELNLPRLRVRPYISARLIADTKPTPNNQALSERSFILGVGIAAQWRHFTTWAEAGSAISYTRGSMLPDYRGGVSWAQSWRNEQGFLFETNADEVFVSRFGNDFLSYLQSRAGWRSLIFNANLTADTTRQHWANFIEAGPGFRIHPPGTAKNLLFSVNLLRGVYLVNDGIPGHSNFNDLRVGFWYAITK
jgi:tetratricopeptide (TPR) repeat protein